MSYKRFLLAITSALSGAGLACLHAAAVIIPLDQRPTTMQSIEHGLDTLSTLDPQVRKNLIKMIPHPRLFVRTLRTQNVPASTALTVLSLINTADEVAFIASGGKTAADKERDVAEDTLNTILLDVYAQEKEKTRALAHAAAKEAFTINALHELKVLVHAAEHAAAEQEAEQAARLAKAQQHISLRIQSLIEAIESTKQQQEAYKQALQAATVDAIVTRACEELSSLHSIEQEEPEETEEAAPTPPQEEEQPAPMPPTEEAPPALPEEVATPAELAQEQEAPQAPAPIGDLFAEKVTITPPAARRREHKITDL